jgi:hypothetical protein
MMWLLSGVDYKNNFQFWLIHITGIAVLVVGIMLLGSVLFIALWTLLSLKVFWENIA